MRGTVIGLDKVLSNLNQSTARIERKAREGMEQVAEALEGWAKVEHSYTDRTTNLTNSIKGYLAEAGPQMIHAVLSASMEYAPFVELARNGKWAFLLPVIERHAKDILAILKFALEN